MFRQDQITEPGGKTLNLNGDVLTDILPGTMGSVAVCPGGMLSIRGTAAVKQALLCQQHEGLFGVLSAPDGLLRGTDFIQGAA